MMNMMPGINNPRLPNNGPKPIGPAPVAQRFANRPLTRPMPMNPNMNMNIANNPNIPRPAPSMGNLSGPPPMINKLAPTGGLPMNGIAPSALSDPIPDRGGLMGAGLGNYGGNNRLGPMVDVRPPSNLPNTPNIDPAKLAQIQANMPAILAARKAQFGGNNTGVVMNPMNSLAATGGFRRDDTGRLIG